MTILVTGGTGVLGRCFVKSADPNLSIRVLSRKRIESNSNGIEFIQGDLRTGEGIQRALHRVDTIVHLATDPSRKSAATDKDGTRKLLAEAKSAGVKHLIYSSIVGVDQIPLPYYKNKFEAEQMITDSGIPFTILRATQFHAFVHSLFSSLSRLPLVPVPRKMLCQSVDETEVANQILHHVKNGPAKRIFFAGPVIETAGEMYDKWAAYNHSNRRSFHAHIPGKVVRSFVEGKNTSSNHSYGHTTWQEWLLRKSTT